MEGMSLAVAGEIAGALENNFGYTKTCDIMMVTALSYAFVYFLI